MKPVPPKTRTLIFFSVGNFSLDRNNRHKLDWRQAMAAVAAAQDALTGTLGGLGARFVLHWGEMAARWGVSRTVAQIHALLFLSGRPLHAEEMAATLQVARSNISTSLRELHNWELVRVVHLAGDRRDHYQTAQDPWELLRVIARQRKAREFDPTLRFLRGCVGSRDFAREAPGAQQRLRETLALMETLSDWSGELLAAEPPGLKKFLRLGARLLR
jgi:DNA-binding transcriptional regulator GbsR (MarR family)